MKKSDVMRILTEGKMLPGIQSVPGERMEIGESRVGAPEAKRRLPGMRKVGKSGEKIEVIRHLEEGVKMTKNGYRQREERIGKGRGGYGFEIAHEGEKPMSGREMMRMPISDSVPMDFSADVGAIDESDFLKPSANKISTEKRVIPHARVSVAGEPGLKTYEQLEPGRHIPVSNVPPSLSIQPKAVRDDFMSFLNVQEAEQAPKKPRKAKRTETYGGMKEMIMDEDKIVEKVKPMTKSGMGMRRMVLEEDNRIVEKPMTTEVVKKKRAPTAYNKFVAEKRKAGFTMSEIGQMYREK